MRALIGLAPLLAGCQVLLGIDDPTGDSCSPFDPSTCELDETCDLGPTGYLDCRIEGTTPAGELCDEDADCAGGLTCMDGGICHAYCETRGEGCTSPDGVCLIDDGYGHNICDSECDVLSGTGCVAGADCLLYTGAAAFVATCSRRDWLGEPVGVDASCADGEFCGIGLACVPGDKVCVPLCTPGGDACADDRICDPVDNLHGQPLGFCLPP